MRTALLASVVAVLLVLCGCKPAAPAVEYAPTSTIREVMKSMVEPSADYLWESVSVIITAKGEDRKMPRTDEDWEELHRRAITLVEVTNLLLMPGRHVAKPNEKADNPDFEREPKTIDEMIAKDRPTFVNHVGALRKSAMTMLAAVEAKNVEAIENEGELLDKACEDCHMTYWYLPDK